MASDMFRVFVNGETHVAPSNLGTLSLNDWLRNYANVKSTKLGCNEGGCGACAVLVSTSDPATGKPTWRSVNSCLMPLYSADGKEVVTAAGLPTGGDDPGVTERMAGFHASQCGFCTPGMSIACASELSKARDAGKAPTAEQMRAAIDGNLCRCTGYRPIIDACKSFAAGVDIEDLGLNCVPNARPAPPSGSTALPPPPAHACADDGKLEYPLGNGRMLHVPRSLQQLTDKLGQLSGSGGVRLLAGNTGPGVFKDWPHDEAHIVSLTKVAELSVCRMDGDILVLGATTTLNGLASMLEAPPAPPSGRSALASANGAAPAPNNGVASESAAAALPEFAAHVRRIAGAHVRNAATIGGNLALTRTHGLPSDVATLLLGARATVVLLDCSGGGGGPPRRAELAIDAFLDASSAEPALALLGRGAALVAEVHVPLPPAGTKLWSSRVAKRYANSAAIANAAVALAVGADGRVAGASVGLGMDLGRASVSEWADWSTLRASGAESALLGLPTSGLPPADAARVLVALAADVDSAVAGAAPARAKYLAAAVEGFVFQAMCELMGAAADGSKLPAPQVSVGKQDWPVPDPAVFPLTQPIPKTAAELQARGTAPYSDDEPNHIGALFAAPLLSTRAVGTIEGIDTSKAEAIPGFVRLLTAADVPGANRGCLTFPNPALSFVDPPLFAEKDVQHAGQLVGCVLAESQSSALRAAKAVEIKYGAAAAPAVLSIDAAIASGSFHFISPMFPMSEPSEDWGGAGIMVRSKDVDIVDAMAKAPRVSTNAKYTFPSQYHMYMEPQTAIVWPDENGGVKCVSSQQSVDMAQIGIAAVLGVPQKDVTCTTRRLGGSFGGKMSHALRPALSAAVGAIKTGKQVRFALDRNSDFAMVGGRCDALAHYDVGFSDDGKILALDMRVYCMAGPWLELSFTELFGLTFHPDSVYDIPALRLQYSMVKCNVPLRTPTRGPGEPQSQVLIENVVEHVAALTGLPPHAVREANMLRPPCGGVGSTALGKAVPDRLYTMPRIWDELKASCGLQAKLADVAAFNSANRWRKRGVSMVPSRYSLQVGKRQATVIIYTDGTIVVAHPGVETGQGLLTKVAQTAAYCLSKALPPGSEPLDPSLVRGADNSTVTLPYNAFTGGSTTSEGACQAVRACCETLVSRLKANADAKQLGDSYTWAELIAAAGGMFAGFPGDVRLIAHEEGMGTPAGEGAPAPQIMYDTYGAGVAVVEVDALTGDRRVLSVDLLYDTGKTLNPAVDLGQTEGAFVFGLGNLLTEAVGVDPEFGTNSTASTWKYKVPGVYCIPEKFTVSLLKDSPLHVDGPISSKAVGEPPLMLSSAVLFALQSASAEAARALGCAPEGFVPLCAPATPEAVKAAVGYASVQRLLKVEA